MRANSENGGNASAPTAPETKAMTRRRQPQDRMTPSTSEARPLARGMTVELARLKETSLVDRRIAIADHSPGESWVRLGADQSPDIAARVWSVAPSDRPAPSAAKPRQTRVQMQKNACIYSAYLAESGLFKDLRPIQTTFFLPARPAACAATVAPASAGGVPVGLPGRQGAFPAFSDFARRRRMTSSRSRLAATRLSLSSSFLRASSS